MQDVPTIPTILLTIPEAADRAGVAPNTIRAWIDSGRLTPTAITSGGRMPLFAAADVDAAAGPIVSSPTVDGTPVSDEETAA